MFSSKASSNLQAALNQTRQAIRKAFEVEWMLPILTGTLRIVNKEKQAVWLKPNIAQLKYLALVAEMIKLKIPVRLYTPKARQEGITTIGIACGYSLCAYTQNNAGLIVADEVMKAMGFLDKLKYMHHQTSSVYRTETQKVNANELIFSETNSFMRIGTAGNDALGRYATFNFLHCSEAAYYPNADVVMLGLLQAVPDFWNTMVTVESTGNGMSGHFYNECEKARKGETDKRLLFLSWHEFPEYIKPLPNDVKFIPQTDGKWGNELQYMKDHNLSVEQLYWRRCKIDNYCNGDLFKFMQEYPATLEECFLASGFPVFDQIILKKIDDKHTNPPIGEYIIDKNKNGKPEVRPAAGGYIKIWKHPVRGWSDRYVAFADTGGKWQGADFYSVHIYDRVEREVVCTLHGHFDAYLFAWYLFIIATHYDKAKVVIEINKWSSETEQNGISVMDNIRAKYRYGNLYMRNVYDQTNKIIDTHYGFHTNSDTKQLLIDRGKRYINDESDTIKINDKNTVKEMKTYIISIKNGASVYEAAQGAKDDRVISFLGALLIADQMTPPELIKIPKRRKTAISDNPLLKLGE
jgi:hypothetical protein